MTVMTGESCSGCARSEAACARDYPCCTDCTHFTAPEVPISFAADGRLRAGENVCGTEAGYLRHRRAGHPPCDACRAAHAAAGRARKDRRNPDRPRRPETAMTTPTPITTAPGQTAHTPTVSELLARARQVNDPKVTRAAAKVEAAALALRDALTDVEENTAARREVERLQRQLAAAKARLRDGVKRPLSDAQRANLARMREAANTPVDCPDCGQTFRNKPGLSSHQRGGKCTGRAA